MEVGLSGLVLVVEAGWLIGIGMVIEILGSVVDNMGMLNGL